MRAISFGTPYMKGLELVGEDFASQSFAFNSFGQLSREKLPIALQLFESEKHDEKRIFFDAFMLDFKEKRMPKPA